SCPSSAEAEPVVAAAAGAAEAVGAAESAKTGPASRRSVLSRAVINRRRRMGMGFTAPVGTPSEMRRRRCDVHWRTTVANAGRKRAPTPHRSLLGQDHYPPRSEERRVGQG